jgi:hypothetical protein
MAAITFRLPFVSVIDEDGNTVSGALLYFYLSETLTQTPVYTDAALSDEHTNPVECNSAGQPPVIYLDSSIEYRLRVHDADDVFLYEVDPYRAQSGAEILTALLGVDGLNSGLDADLVRGTTPSTGGLAWLAGTVAEVGIDGADLTLVPSYAGRVIRNINSVSRNAVISPEADNAWPAGSFMIIGSRGSGNTVITRGTGVALLLAGTDKNVTITAGGFAFLFRTSSNSWTVIGSGLS